MIDRNPVYDSFVTGSVDCAATAIWGFPPADTFGTVICTEKEPVALVLVVARTSLTFAAVKIPTCTVSTPVGFAGLPCAEQPEKF